MVQEGGGKGGNALLQLVSDGYGDVRLCSPSLAEGSEIVGDRRGKVLAGDEQSMKVGRTELASVPCLGGDCHVFL